MKGLLIKDLFAVKKQGKIVMIFLVFYVVYSVAMKNVSMLGAMITLLCAMMPITTMSYDEYCKWDRYALTMPITRKTIVLSKYLFSILLDIAAMCIVAPTSAIMVIFTKEMEVGEALLTTAAIGGVALVFLSIILPLLFKFGVEKGRMLLMLVIFVPTILVFLLNKMGFKMPDEHTLKLFAYASPVIVILVLLVSIWVSIGIYEKKEM